jgi:hypothetical protein
MYIYSPILEEAAPTVFMVWLQAWYRINIRLIIYYNYMIKIWLSVTQQLRFIMSDFQNNLQWIVLKLSHTFLKETADMQ